MKFVFFGNPEFSAIILQGLIKAGFPPELVVCNPDKPVGRKKIVTPPPVKQRIKDLGLRVKVIQPERLTPELFCREGWDFFLVVAYGKIIPKSILEIPCFGVLNVHPSLLPRHRGPTPIQSAILDGDETTGVSIMRLDEEIDHGPLLMQRKLEIGNWKLEIAQAELARLGTEMLVDVLPKFLRGEIKPTSQDHTKATYTKKFTADDAFVDFEDLKNAIKGDNLEKAREIERKIRALNPEPGAWTITKEAFFGLPKEKRVKLLEAEVRDGKLALKKIQADGEKPRKLT